MANPSNIWMPLYVGDYLADTMELSTVEHGAYLLLLMAYWKNGGPLLDDPKKLSLICRMSLSEFSAIRSALETFFFIQNGLWINKRADQEIKKWSEFKDDKEFGAAIANFKKNNIPMPERFAQRYAQRTLSVTPPPPPLPLPSALPPPPKKNNMSEGDAVLMEKFEEARLAYPGSKRGLDSEWEDFKKKHGKQVPEYTALLMDGITEGITYRNDLSKLKARFIPPWKNFKTWLHQKCWEERFPEKVFV